MEIAGQPHTAIQIPCCLCGVSIYPNAANQCGACLAQQFDLKSMVQKGPGGGDINIYQCRRCRRYEHTENFHQHHEPESPELLQLCLRNIPALQSNKIGSNQSSTSDIHQQGLSNVKLIDSMWIWTEPHSMRMKLRLTVQADVGESPRCVTVEQRVPVELVVRFKQCPDCGKEFTNRTWMALVQVRQKRNDDGPKKGLVILEEALAKNADVRKHIIRMETSRNGFDFYFLEHGHAQNLASFLARVAPMRIKSTQKLVSEDRRNNSAHVKHTISCDMVPLCRDDLIICDKQASKDGCGAGRLTGHLCLVGKTSGVTQLIDAAPTRQVADKMENMFADLHPEKYYKGEKYYRIVFSSQRLVRFVVLDVDLCGGDHAYNYDDDERDLYAGPNSGIEKYALADVELARESDFGVTDETFQCITHLGNLLQIGDIALGYDLVATTLTGADEWSFDNSLNSHFTLPDVVLVKKVQGNGEDATSNKKDEDECKAENTSNKPTAGSRKRETKKRERRQRRKEKKMRELEETAARMGLLDDAIDEEDGGEERKEDQQELEMDPELAKELQWAEQELAKSFTNEKEDDNGECDQE